MCRLGINKRAARQLALQRLGLLPKESEQDQPEAAQPEYQQPPQTDTPTSTMPEGQGTLLETAFAEAESEVAAPVISVSINHFHPTLIQISRMLCITEDLTLALSISRQQSSSLKKVHPLTIYRIFSISASV